MPSLSELTVKGRTLVHRPKATRRPSVGQRPKQIKTEARGSAPAPDSRSEITQELALLSVSEIAEGDQILPLDQNLVEAMKESISIGGQASPITLRKVQDGRFELLDGGVVVAAMRELQRRDISAIVLHGLSDWDASFRRIASYIRRNLTALDKALVYDRLLELVQEKASQVETPAGGRQPAEKYVRKLARHLGVSKDQVGRSLKIAGISHQVHERIRALGLADNSAAMLKIAAVGDDVDLQMAKAEELGRRPKKGKTEPPMPALPKVPDGANTDVAKDASDIPLYLRRDRPEIGFDQIKEKWFQGEVLELLLAADHLFRRRFVDDCVMPSLFSTPVPPPA